MPLTPNFIERLAFLTLNQAPALGLDLWAGPAFWGVHTAMKLNLFAVLAHNSMTATEFASTSEASEHGISILLGVLQSLGYVTQSNGRYANSAMTRKWLLATGDINFTPFFLYWGALMRDFMPNLTESMCSGSPPVELI